MRHDSTLYSNRHSMTRLLAVAPAVRAGAAFWIGVALIVLAAAVPRFWVYDYGLPYIEYIDEVQLYWYGQAARGLSEAKLSNITFYPPAFIQMHVAVQTLLEALEQAGPAATILALRTGAVITNLAGIVFIALAGRLLAGDLAGWAAAAAWGAAPVVVDMSVLAIGESYVYPLMALCLWLLVGAWLQPDRWRWALASVLVALLIFLFEYRLVVVLLPGVAILLWRFNQQRGLPIGFWLIAAAGIAAIVIGIYLFGPPRFVRWLNRIFSDDLWDLPLLAEHIASTFAVLNWLPVIVCSVLGVVGWFRGRRQVDFRLIAAALLLIFLIDWAAAAVRWVGDEGVRIQNTLPATVIVCLLMGLGVAQVGTSRLGRLTAVGVLLLIVGVQVPPMRALMNNRQVQNWQVIIRQWADENVPAGTVIVYGDHDRTFNPFWGGIQGRQWFDWWPTNNILEFPLDEWVEQRGMTYALLPIGPYNALQASADGQALLAKLLPLREFAHPPVRREPEGIFLRLWRMQHETDVRFGDHIRLTGYDQSAEAVHPGDALDFTFYWNAPTTPDDNYSLFVHLVPQDEYTVLAQADGSPAVPERLTLSWDESTETLISPPFTLNIPSDIAPGDYRVIMGLYNFSTGVRLPVADSDLGDAYLLTTLHVDAQ